MNYSSITIQKEDVQDFQMLHGYKDWQEHPNYKQAFAFVHYLIQDTGKDKLLEFCSQLGEKESYEDFCKKFKDNFGEDLNDYKQKWIQEF